MNDSQTDVNAKDESGRTRLHLAVAELSINSLATTALLLVKGADVNATDADGRTPLSLAEANNASETSTILRNYGGK